MIEPGKKGGTEGTTGLRLTGKESTQHEKPTGWVYGLAKVYGESTGKDK